MSAFKIRKAYYADRYDDYSLNYKQALGKLIGLGLTKHDANIYLSKLSK